MKYCIAASLLLLLVCVGAVAPPRVPYVDRVLPSVVWWPNVLASAISVMSDNTTASIPARCRFRAVDKTDVVGRALPIFPRLYADDTIEKSTDDCWAIYAKLDNTSMRPFNRDLHFSIHHPDSPTNMREMMWFEFLRHNWRFLEVMQFSLLYLKDPNTYPLSLRTVDWRYDPQTLVDRDQIHERTQQLVEENYRKSNNTPVVLVAEGYGAALMTMFLRSMDQEWKDKYIATYVSASGDYFGTLSPMLNWFPTRDEGMPEDAWKMSMATAQVMRTFGSTIWRLPGGDAFRTHVIAIEEHAGGRETSYTVADLPNLLDKIGLADVKDKYLRMNPYGKVQDAPGVEVYCFSGSGVPTASAFRFKMVDDRAVPTGFDYSDGDGWVPRSISEELCRIWFSAAELGQNGKHHVHRKTYFLHDTTVLGDKFFLEDMYLLLRRYGHVNAHTPPPGIYPY